MQNYLICNVSDQTIPTVLFINEMKKLYDISMIFFITTEYSHVKMVNIVDACPEFDDKFKEIVLPSSDSIKEIKKTLDIYFDKPEYSEARFYVDITCGTKIMSISVYEFFKEFSSDIFYINHNKESYRKVYPGNQREEIKFKFEIPLRVYLKAYGVDIKRSGGSNSNMRNLNNFFNLYKDMKNRAILTKLRIRHLKGKPNNRKKPYFEIKTVENLGKLCECLGFKDNLLTTKQIEFLTGGWFEEYLFSWLKEIVFENMAINCHIVNKVNDVPNELDIAFVYKNSLYIIEAKTNMKGKKGLEKDTLYKSKALEKNFGLRTKTIIATLDKELPQNVSFANRAELMSVDLMFEKYLEPENILSNLKKMLGA